MNEYIAKMYEHIAKLKAWWQERQLREKKAMTIGGVLLGIFLIYQLMWSPLLQKARDARNRIQKAEKTLVWMQAADTELKKRDTGITRSSKPLTAVQLLSLLQKQIEQAGLSASLTSLKQVSENEIEVQFVNVEFDALARLLGDLLKSQPVTITQMSAIAQESPGVVNVEMMVSVEDANASHST